MASTIPSTGALPDVDVMYDAIARRDTSLDGVFVVGVKTTGIFCRPGCAAKTPLRKNVEFFGAPREAVYAGYRPCMRCRPMDPAGQRPEWVERVIKAVEGKGQRKLSAADLRAMKIHPAKASRYFKAHYGMTFQAYQRARRVGLALAKIRQGASMSSATMQAGYESESGLREAFVSLFGEPPKQAAGGGAGALAAKWFSTPLGPMLAVASEQALLFLEFIDRRALETQIATLRRRVTQPIVPGENAILQQLGGEFDRYLAGKLKRFTVPIEAPGTPFQQRVWAELCKIPCGETRSYLDVAKALGQPTATRAVARANGDNRVAILIPCHRVIGKDGTLTGYGGGLWRKEWLLGHENVLLGGDSGRISTPVD